jgi:hypothetical protein
MASISTGRSAFRRLPHTRSEASQQDEGVSFSLLVCAPPRAAGSFAVFRGPKQSHGVLAMEPSDEDELIQNPRLLRSAR